MCLYIRILLLQAINLKHSGEEYNCLYFLRRSGVGTIYAHSEGSTEIFVKSPLNKVSAGIPSRRDVESCIKIAQQKLKDLPPINSQ